MAGGVPVAAPAVVPTADASDDDDSGDDGDGDDETGGSEGAGTASGGGGGGGDGGGEEGATSIASVIATNGYYITDRLDLETGCLARCEVDAAGTISGVAEPLREISEVRWRLSSARPGNGIDELLDDDLETYWQSDGAAPHSIAMTFYKRETVAELALYLDYRRDESYTPAEVVVRAGSLQADCEDLVRLRLTEPVGWIRVPFLNTAKAGVQQYLRANVLTVTVFSNHQAGRDTHIRCIKVLAPGGAPSGVPGGGGGGGGGGGSGLGGGSGTAADAPPAGAPSRRLAVPSFTSSALTQFATLR